MEITVDVILKGEQWNKVIDALKEFFPDKTNYKVFILCLATGIMYDERIEKFDDNGYDAKHIARNVLINSDNGLLDLCFQAAILSSSTIDMTEKERLELAFSEKKKFNKMGFLTEFANYGVTKIEDLMGITSRESIFNLTNYLIATVKDKNIDVDLLADELLLEDE